MVTSAGYFAAMLTVSCVLDYVALFCSILCHEKICGLLYCKVKLRASVVFVKAFCVDVRLAEYLGRSCKDLPARSRDHGHLEYPWTSQARGHCITGYQQNGCLRWEGCLEGPLWLWVLLPDSARSQCVGGPGRYT